MVRVYIDESGREHQDRDFIVGGVLARRRAALTARLRLLEQIWPFLTRPLHGAHLRQAGYLAKRWREWADAQDLTDPREGLRCTDMTPSEFVLWAWQQRLFSEHILFQSWLARSGASVAGPALMPAAFFRRVDESCLRASPPATDDIGALRDWAYAVDLYGSQSRAFQDLIWRDVQDLISDPALGYEVIIAVDDGALRAERDRYLQLLRAALTTAHRAGAKRARIQHRYILPPEGGGARPVSLRYQHLDPIPAGLRCELISFHSAGEAGDEIADLLLGRLRRCLRRGSIQGALGAVPIHLRRIPVTGLED